MDIKTVVAERLRQLGYEPTPADDGAIDYHLKKTEIELLCATNQRALPAALCYMQADMAVGRFLSEKKASGGLNGAYDFEAVVKSIGEGDTSITYAVGDEVSAEGHFNMLLEKLSQPDMGTLLAHRRLQW